MTMEGETFKSQLRKKILDLKSDSAGFYTELYNLVEVMVRLNPDAFEKPIVEKLERKMLSIYAKPDSRYPIGLAQLEKMYFTYKDDPNLRIRSKTKVDMNDIKRVLDTVRRDLLFYLALVEDRPKNYDIVIEQSAGIE